MLGVVDILCSYAVNGCDMPGWCVWTCVDPVCGYCVWRKKSKMEGLFHTHCGAIIIRDNDYNKAEKPTRNRFAFFTPFGQGTAFRTEKPKIQALIE